MKKTVLIGSLIIACNSLFAQKSKVTSASNYLKYENYAEAKEAIDLAVANAVTADWWKTHYYRGKVYAAIAGSVDPAVVALDSSALYKSVEGFEKTLSYNDKKMDKEQINKDYRSLVNLAFSDGVSAYNAKRFDRSIKSFKIAEKINLANGVVDTGLTYNIVLVALDAMNNAVAMEYLNKCIEGGIKGSSPYTSKALLEVENDNDSAALETLKAGRVKYPNDQSLLTQELNIYLKNGKMDEALANLNVAIENDPTNYIFYFARGTIYDSKKDFENSVSNYVKAGELNPDHFDSFYNLGAMYYNKGAEELNEANEVPPSDVEQYEKKKDKAVATLEKSLPYLEKAHEINASDLSTMMSLKTVYILLRKTEKVAEIQKKIDANNGTAE